MMQVAPMPERPPFMNGLTAFQVELSAKDMVWRVVGFVRLREAYRVMRVADGGCDGDRKQTYGSRW